MKLLLLTLAAALPLLPARAQTTPAAPKPALAALPGPPPPAPVPLDTTGWRFAQMPRVEALDDHSGAVRFRITLNETGAVERVVTLQSTVSAAQQQLCREALERATFVRLSPTAGRSSGEYTFRFTVR
ncbi:TonB family protein [Hymenobacter sp. ASUV-10]|uniref:TonB family protein n=1 Tax=Hymenobacter aranciens TaxID=3063996 RepID=A0ABT9BDY7_9BACT|nr:TonB family protein [Hymenobacter sp. ASUV-10]MDO7876464.1 TonB family protein [Hymenobacter sp. ASUV-10]